MIKVLFAVSVFLFTFSVQAQVKDDVVAPAVTEEEKVYDINAVDKQPEFRGGVSALQRYLAGSVRYPEVSRKNNSQGRVMVRFIINSNGTVASPQVLKSSGDFYLDMEALRVIEAMPKWKPGRIGKKKVRVYFVMPIGFTLR